MVNSVSSSYAYSEKDISANLRMPFPVVTGGLGLMFAYVFPGGLTGGQGALIGFIVGIFIRSLAVFWYSWRFNTQIHKIVKEREVAEMAKHEMEIARMAREIAGTAKEIEIVSKAKEIASRAEQLETSITKLKTNL